MAEINSMTGFASAQGAALDFNWSWEMRAVNAKGLDLRLRVPDWVDGLEVALRKQLGAALGRGNVTLNLRLHREDGGGATRLNRDLLTSVLHAMSEIEQEAMNQGLSLAPSTAADIVGLRGMLDAEDTQTDVAALRTVLIEDFQKVLEDFSAMRRTEGAALKDILTGQITEISRLVAAADTAAEARRPKTAEALKTALKNVVDATDDLDETRVAQELALLAVKSDITEEINRLQAHVDAAHRLIDAGGLVGRKLDFLMQEFNREANTLCSKSGDSALTAIGLDLKAVIDQLREQVQNVE